MSEEILEDVRKGRPSASGMQRLVLCPGSWMAEKGYPEESSEAAEAGTRLHAHMEHGTLPEDAAEAEAVEWCRAQEVALAEKYLGWGSAADERCLREQRWWFKDVFSGQADVVYVANGMALVLDYKFGRVPVAAARDNMQLAALALLALKMLPDVDVVFCGILQPFASRQEPGVVRYHREMNGQLECYFMHAVAKAESEGARRVPGEVQCRYCKAKAECPACMALVSSATGGPASADLSQGLSTPRQQLSEATSCWADWSAEKKAEAVRLAGLAKKWAEAVERKAKADLKSGLAIPGCSLAAGKRSFKVNDAQGAFAVLARELGISGEEFAGCCSVKISELDKVVHKRLCERADEGTKVLVKESSRWLREALADFGAESVSEGSLKSE